MIKFFSICLLISSSLFCNAQMGDCYKPVKLDHKKIKGARTYYNRTGDKSLGYISFNTYYNNNIEYLLNYAYDIKLYKSFYLESGIGLNYYDVLSYDSNDPTSEYVQNYTGSLLGINASLSPKWYFTQHIREGNGKTIRGNAGEFIGIKSSLVYSPRFDITKTIYYIGPIVGIRRTFLRNFLAELSLGALYSNREIIDKSFSGMYTATLYPEVNLRVGYLFFR